MKITFEGCFTYADGHGEYDRQMVYALDSIGVDVVAHQRRWDLVSDQITLSERFKELMNKPHHGQDGITVRHSQLHNHQDWDGIVGKLRIATFFWESFHVDSSWVEVMVSDRTDYIYTATRYVRQGFIESGVPEDKVFIVPCGVDVDWFHPGVEPIKLPTEKTFKFLHLGVISPRKFTDGILDAYVDEFSASDDCCLVLKLHHLNQGLAEEVVQKARARKPDAPEILYIWSEDSQDMIRRYYTACDCFVYPSRTEGWGMTVTEAMASGLPVIVTGLGPELRPGVPHPFRDQVDESMAWLCRFDWVATENGVSANIDSQHLCQLMRYAYEHPDQGEALGILAREHTVKNLTWKHAARWLVDAIEDKL